jgi:hypothetical protein
MLFENDGGAADVLNAYAELFGDGKVMDAMRPWLGRRKEAEAGLVAREVRAAAETVHEQVERRAMCGDLGVIPDFTVPVRLYHAYAAAFKMRAEEAGVELPDQGYECWHDEDFVEWFKRKYPELVFKEQKRNARIIVNERGAA